MRILIVGLGSIGRKHLSILEQMKGLQLGVLRSSFKIQNFNRSYTEFYTVEDALNFEPDGAIICTPTSMHIEGALPFLQRGIKVLIEKPVADSTENLVKLLPYEHLIKVAYCFRFLNTYEFLKSEFTNNIPFKVSFKRSYYLPHWHPNSDYRMEYVAQKSLGGGVLRTLSHEIDLAVNWFGEVRSVQGLIDQIGFLEMDTDDFAFFSLKMKNDTRVNFELDLYSPQNINQGEAFTREGKYAWNLNQVIFSSYDQEIHEVVFNRKENTLNKMYELQLQDFLSFIQRRNSNACNLKEAIISMNIIESIK